MCHSIFANTRIHPVLSHEFTATVIDAMDWTDYLSVFYL